MNTATAQWCHVTRACIVPEGHLEQGPWTRTVASTPSSFGAATPQWLRDEVENRPGLRETIDRLLMDGSPGNEFFDGNDHNLAHALALLNSSRCDDATHTALVAQGRL